MRWFVEVSSLSSDASAQRLTVEAATWQGALAQGRNVSRDTAPLSNFTIEVLAEGYRATNGVARTRYVVSKAPDNAPLTSEPTSLGGKPATIPPPDSKSPAATAASALGRRASVRPKAPDFSLDKPVEAKVVERGKIILRKAEDPGPKSPLTYRELAIALPPGTPSQLAMAVARANLDDVRAELDRAKAPAGRLVQLAVFDHEWKGRPERAPLIALTWKDWKGNDPEVKGTPAAAPKPPVDARGITNDISSAVEAARPPRPVATAPDVPPAVEAIVSPSTSLAAARPAPVPVPVPEAAKPEPPKPEPPKAEPPKAEPPKPEPPKPEPPKPEPPKAEPAKPAEPVAPPAPAKPAIAAVPKTPLPSVVIAPVPPTPAPVAAPVSVPVAADPFAAPPSSQAPRSSRPDDLMSEIFESMHDIHFMRDALDGADFVLELLREKIPTILALVHFYDINAKEFVIVKARTPNGTSVAGKTREGTGLVGDALKTGKPVLVKDAPTDERWSREAYGQGGHQPREIVVIPMRHHGRFLGAIELADHTDGESFGDNEIHAASYVAEQFAEFVQDRGILISRGADSTGSFQVIEPPRRR